MKIFAIVKKNLKMLFRSKGTAVMSILGPLLIILLVGLAFNNSKESEFYAGVFSPDNTSLTQTFVDNLRNDNFIVQKFPSEDQCIQKVEEGFIHTCIIFPENFAIENQRTNEIVIFIDNSRTNLVYQVISALSKNLEMKSSELSLSMTNLLLQTLFTTKDSVSKDVLRIINLKKKAEESGEKDDEVIGIIKGIQFSDARLDLSAIDVGTKDITHTLKEIYDVGMMIIQFSREFADDVQRNTSFDVIDFRNEISLFEIELNELNNVTPQKIDRLVDRIGNVQEEINDINEQMNTARSTLSDAVFKLEQLKISLDQITGDLTVLQSSLENIIARIDSVEVTSAQSIVSPVTTTIKPVSSHASKLLFLFPGLLMLVILFIGLFLSGTLIIMEKGAKASFRNFTTPTRGETFLAGHFLTSAGLLLVQVLFILVLASLLLNTNLFANFGITLLILLLCITLFVSLGIVIGNIFSTQEGVMMVSMSVGTIFLLLSNFLFPIEEMAGVLSAIVPFNPFVLGTDLLKQVLLFNTSFSELVFLLFLLLMYILVAVILAFFSKNFTRAKSTISRAFIHYHPPDSEIVLAHGKTVRTVHELIAGLKEMNEAEFVEHIAGETNDFAIWLTAIDPVLAKSARGLGKKDLTDLLEKYVLDKGRKKALFSVKRKE